MPNTPLPLSPAQSLDSPSKFQGPDSNYSEKQKPTIKSNRTNRPILDSLILDPPRKPLVRCSARVEALLGGSAYGLCDDTTLVRESA
jgi:hypothetical protein